MKRSLLLILAALSAIAGCASTPRRTETTYYRNDGSQTQYTQAQPTYRSQPTYQAQPTYQTQPTAQQQQTKKILTQAAMGAATGAIAAEVSGGKAGTGALVGAGTNVLGSALFDMLSTPPAQNQQVAQNPQYAPYVNNWTAENQSKKKIIRKYDSQGNIVSEEEVWQ